MYDSTSYPASDSATLNATFMDPASMSPTFMSEARLDQPLSEALELTKNRMRVVGLRGKTNDEYFDEGDAFRLHFRSVYGHEPTISDLTVANADRFLLSLQEKAVERDQPWTQGTTRHHVDQFRGLGKYLAQAISLPVNPLTGLSARKADRLRSEEDREPLLDWQIVRILDALDRTKPFAVVTRALIALCFEVGPRTSELVSLEVSDFKLATVNDFVLGPIIDIRHPAKTSPKRRLPLGVCVEELIREAIGNRRSGPMFPGRDGGFTTPRALRSRISRVGQRLEIPLSPQRLRRSAASTQASYNAGSGHLDKVFGWAPDPRDVKSGYYTSPNLEQLMEAHQSHLSPLDRLELRLGSKGLPPVR